MKEFNDLRKKYKLFHIFEIHGRILYSSEMATIIQKCTGTKSDAEIILTKGSNERNCFVACASNSMNTFSMMCYHIGYKAAQIDEYRQGR